MNEVRQSLFSLHNKNLGTQHESDQFKDEDVNTCIMLIELKTTFTLGIYKMKLLATLGLVTSSVLISSCGNTAANSNLTNDSISDKTQNYSVCEKIDALVNAYENDFEKIKLKPINSKISQLWKAKYHLVGNNCEIWSWGTKATTYSCSVTAPNKIVAQRYFENAKSEAIACIDDSWKMTESPSNNNKGFKLEFDNSTKGMRIAAHMVPTGGWSKSGWSVYYYIGSLEQPY